MNRGVRKDLLAVHAFAMHKRRDHFRFVRWGVRNVAPRCQEGDPLKIAVRRGRTDPASQSGLHGPRCVRIQSRGCLCSLHQQLKTPSPNLEPGQPPTSGVKRNGDPGRDWLRDKQAHLRGTENPTPPLQRQTSGRMTAARSTGSKRSQPFRSRHSIGIFISHSGHFMNRIEAQNAQAFPV